MARCVDTESVSPIPAPPGYSPNTAVAHVTRTRRECVSKSPRGDPPPSNTWAMIGLPGVDIIVVKPLVKVLLNLGGSTSPSLTATPGRISRPKLTPMIPGEVNERRKGFNGPACVGATSASPEKTYAPLLVTPMRVVGWTAAHSGAGAGAGGGWTAPLGTGVDATTSNTFSTHIPLLAVLCSNVMVLPVQLASPVAHTGVCEAPNAFSPPSRM
mmetsp:Transcript_16018/g.39002  ORF Transcript_16018/g.39002 Transcript_16018/m.39002 type:complete len:213 (+) Transcript_16018:1003-1641(+)